MLRDELIDYFAWNSQTRIKNCILFGVIKHGACVVLPELSFGTHIPDNGKSIL
jgi:hypothetical protein